MATNMVITNRTQLNEVRRPSCTQCTKNSKRQTNTSSRGHYELPSNDRRNGEREREREEVRKEEQKGAKQTTEGEQS